MSEFRHKQIKAAAAGDFTLLEGKAGRRYEVLAVGLMAKTEVDVVFKSGGDEIFGPLYPGANGGAVLNLNELAWFKTAAGQPLILALSGAVAVGGGFLYREI